MKALTLHRPWPWAIFDLPPDRAKRVENRTWAPPDKLVGEVIAIHAGLKLDKAALDRARRVSGHVPPSDGGPTGIIGVVRLGWAVHASPSPWFFGPYGWQLDDVRRLSTSIPCRGAQGLWTVPPEIERLVLADLATTAPRPAPTT